MDINASIWNLKKKNRIDESIYRLGMEEMQKMDLWTQGGEGWGTN